MTYASRNWKAVETTDPAGAKHLLTVKGEVQVTRSNETPKLIAAQPPGINPTILILDVLVESHGEIGGDVMLWKAAEYVENIHAQQFTGVMIAGAVDEVSLKVEEILS